ncbi:MAG TPA: hypothetical protein VHW03_03240 [Chthoniobacterales bacterium]|nr:hypothetical protein [Chthoniobacterales bacterium]
MTHAPNLTDSSKLPRNFFGKENGRRTESPPGLKLAKEERHSPLFCGWLDYRFFLVAAFFFVAIFFLAGAFFAAFFAAFFIAIGNPPFQSAEAVC